MSLSNPLLLIGGIILIWFVARFSFGQRFGAPSIGGMFRREASMEKHGLGPTALRTMLDDFKTLVKGDNALRGLILAGPFASHQGATQADVTMIVLSNDIAAYAGRSWFARWPYINRGHLVRSHEESATPHAILHRLALRGAPALVVVFLDIAASHPPEEIADALQQGAIVAETGTPDAKIILEKWAALEKSTSMNSNSKEI